MRRRRSGSDVRCEMSDVRCQMSDVRGKKSDAEASKCQRLREVLLGRVKGFASRGWGKPRKRRCLTRLGEVNRSRTFND